MAVVPLTAISKQGSEKKTFVWKIPNFAEMLKSKEVINQQNFTFEFGHDVGLPARWETFLQIWTDDGRKWVGVFIKPLEYPKHLGKLHAHVRFQIRRPRGRGDYFNSSFNKDMLTLQSDEDWGYSKVIPQDEPLASLPLTSDGSLKMNITMTIFNSEQRHDKQGFEQKAFLWKISNFAEMRGSLELLDEQKCAFEMGREIGLLTSWECYLVTEFKNGKDVVGVFTKLKNYPHGLADLKANIRFQANGFDGTIPGVNIVAFKQQGFADVITPEDALTLTTDGALEITVTVTLFNTGSRNSQLASIVQEHDLKFVSRFRDDLASICTNPPDIRSKPTKIVAADGKEFPVYPMILAARSPVFRAMFESNMKETESGVVKVEDMASNSISALLEFCHTGNLSEVWSEAGVIEDLVYGAEKYMLEDLKEFFDKTLGLACTNDNLGKLLSLAKAIGLKEAESSLMEYFKQNMAPCLEKMEWREKRKLQESVNPGSAKKKKDDK